MCNVSQYAVFVFRARMQLTSFTLVWENIEYRLKIDIYRFMKKYSSGQAQTGDNGKTESSRQ